jgi:hypothetical protein
MMFESRALVSKIRFFIAYYSSSFRFSALTAAMPAISGGRKVKIAIVTFIDDVRLAVHQTTLVFDLSILLGLVLVAGASLKLAEFAPVRGSRNSAADDIAQRFAAPEASGQFDNRFDFAPRLRFYGAAPAGNTAPDESQERADPAAGTPSMADAPKFQPAQFDFQEGAFDALGLVVVRDLPAESTLSAGMRVSPTEWALAQADLKDLTLTLPGSAGPDIKAGIEVFASSGVAAGGMELQIKRLPLVAAVTDGAAEGAGPSANLPTRKGNIATGAIVQKHQLRKPAIAGRSVKKIQVKLRKLPYRKVAAKAPPAPNIAVQAADTPAPTPKTVIQSLFTPAAEAGKPVKVEGVGQGILINLGVFPRSPMEEEAMRR